MSYYLSQPNKSYITPFINQLLRSKKDEVFETKSPKRFAYILRNGFHLINPILVDKYTIKVGDSTVRCILKNPEVINLLLEILNTKVMNSLEILQLIVMTKPEQIRFLYPEFKDEEDEINLKNTLLKMNYKAERDENNYFLIKRT